MEVQELAFTPVGAERMAGKEVLRFLELYVLGVS